MRATHWRRVFVAFAMRDKIPLSVPFPPFLPPALFDVTNSYIPCDSFFVELSVVTDKMGIYTTAEQRESLRVPEGGKKMDCRS